MSLDEKTDCPFPTVIEAFNKKIPIVAIYAGCNCSFAIARTGALYVWGDVK